MFLDVSPEWGDTRKRKLHHRDKHIQWEPFPTSKPVSGTPLLLKERFGSGFHEQKYRAKNLKARIAPTSLETCLNKPHVPAIEVVTRALVEECFPASNAAHQLAQKVTPTFSLLEREGCCSKVVLDLDMSPEWGGTRKRKLHHSNKYGTFSNLFSAENTM